MGYNWQGTKHKKRPYIQGLFRAGICVDYGFETILDNVSDSGP